MIEARDGMRTIHTARGQVFLRRERLGADEYIEFLARTDLGSQYPRERFRQRIGRLVKNAQISLAARDGEGAVVGCCFGLTDFAYWLLITDLGVDRRYERNGIGRALCEWARIEAGGRRDIIVFVNANEDAIGFYEKMGMKRSASMMELTDVEWADFTVRTTSHTA